MEETIVHAVAIRGLGPDSNGVNQYEWLTDKEFKNIMEAITNGQAYVVIGGNIVQTRDILRTKQMKLREARDLPSFKSYVLDVLKAEKAEAAKLENPEGRRRIEALMEKSRFGHSIL